MAVNRNQVLQDRREKIQISKTHKAFKCLVLIACVSGMYRINYITY